MACSGTIDIIVPVWTESTPYDKLLKCVEHVGRHTNNYRLILSGSDKSQPININRALEIAKSKYIAILDWDVYVSPNWMEQLSEVLDNTKVGIVGAKMAGTYNGLNSTCSDIAQEWPTLAGGCLLFKNIGLRWDENFPSGYWADTDFCRQFKEKGYQVWIDGRTVVEHQMHTSGQSPEGEAYYRKKWGDNEF